MLNPQAVRPVAPVAPVYSPLCSVVYVPQLAMKIGRQLLSSFYLVSIADQADSIIRLEDRHRLWIGHQFLVSHDRYHRRACSSAQVGLCQHLPHDGMTRGSCSQLISILLTAQLIRQSYLPALANRYDHTQLPRSVLQHRFDRLRRFEYPPHAHRCDRLVR
jgi:hypothetical protein